MGILSDIRTRTAWVVERARHVRIDDARLEALAREIAPELGGPAPVEDPVHGFAGDDDTRLALVVTLDAVNFGSGWFPVLRKRPGCSGYLTVAHALAEHFQAHGAFGAADLRALETEGCARIFGQDLEAQPEIGELMALFARSLADLGALLERRYEGSFAKLVAAAEGSAEALVGVLAEMPLYRDVSVYHDVEVPFFKRAQLTAADLAQAFDGEGPGAFRDLDSLTLFADNLVPHVLRRAGVLDYDSALAATIDGEQLLEYGCEAEIEIRACAVQAVERMVECVGTSGRRTTAQELDYLLWGRGQHPSIKAWPRHRSRTSAY